MGVDFCLRNHGSYIPRVIKIDLQQLCKTATLEKCKLMLSGHYRVARSASFSAEVETMACSRWRESATVEVRLWQAALGVSPPQSCQRDEFRMLTAFMTGRLKFETPVHFMVTITWLDRHLSRQMNPLYSPPL